MAISLLSSPARVQVPWIKVTIGNYTFGAYTKETRSQYDDQGFYTAYGIQYPRYITSLNITKINGQVNTYSLKIDYPVTANDDPNFFEKVFSSVSSTRKIVFSYGDASMPSYIYKDEEAIITKVSQTFNFGNGGEMGSVIGYTVEAVSSATLGLSGSYTFLNSGLKKPSTVIKDLFKNKNYGLQSLFTGMTVADLEYFIDGSDKAVELESKQNIAILDYIKYLVSCMVPSGSNKSVISSDIYILTLHDDTTYDEVYQDRERINGNGRIIKGPYFKVTKTTYAAQQTDAYEIDIGYNTSTIVTNFQVDNNDSYSMYFDYQGAITDNSKYVKRLNDNGQWEDIFAPTISSKNDRFKTRPEDMTWWTKITKYPIGASITVQGLLRPATLMQYIRLNVIFPGGHKHASSGLYIVTKQQDSISGAGYRTQLTLTRIGGDTNLM